MGAHQDRVEGIRVAAQQFVEKGHFDAENIKAKQVNSLMKVHDILLSMIWQYGLLTNILDLIS